MIANRRSKRSLIGWTLLALFNCAIVIPWLSSLAPHPRDFDCFYAATQLYKSNPGHLLYGLQLQRQAEQQMFSISDALMTKYFLPYNHLPYELVLWLPVTTLPVHVAFWLWRIVSLVLLAIASWLMSRTIKSTLSPLLVFLIALAFFPVTSSLMTGQDTSVTVLLIAVSLWLLKARRNCWAGVVLGLGLFKMQLVVPLIGVLFLCGYWRVIAGFVSSSVALLTISTAMVGADGMRGLFRLWVSGENGALFCIRPAMMPNLRGLLTAISSLSPHSVSVLTILASFILLLLAAQNARKAPSIEHSFAIGLCFVVLVSFHTNVYDLSILLLPTLVVLDSLPLPTRLRGIAVPPVFLLLFTPGYILATAALKIGLIAVPVGWLWFAVGYGLRERPPEAVERLATVPEFVAGL